MTITEYLDRMLCTVDRVQDTLVLMDLDGEVLALHEIDPRKGGRKTAKRVLQRWNRLRPFAVADAMNLI